jgi:hypothetical protein
LRQEGKTMPPRSGLFLPASILLLSFQSAFLAAAQKASPTGPVGITVRVYNFAKIDSRRLERTQGRASEIFTKAGFEIHWIQCPRYESERSHFPDCTPELGPTDLILKFMPRIDMERIGFRKEAFGFTAGKNILISTELLEDIAQNSEQTCDRILGLAVAHEIGHALLGSNSHSSRGIMCPRWDSKDLQREDRQSASFTEEQIDRMHRLWMVARDDSTGRHGQP